MSLGSTGRQRRAAAPLKKANVKAQPLELLVVGQQLTMRPVKPRRTVKSMATVAAPAATAAAAARVKSPVAGTEQLLEEGNYVYVFKSYPFELWRQHTQLDMPRESPPLLVKQQQLPPSSPPPPPQPPQQLPIAQQVLDARFLAELFDELLLCDD